MFDTADKAEMRALSLECMDATARVMRPSTAPRSYGAAAPEPTEVFAGVRCRSTPLSGEEGVQAGVEASQEGHLVVLDGVLEVKPQDYVEITFDDGREMRVNVKVAEDPTSYQVDTRLFTVRAR
jgi:hypothetical protein